MASNIDFVGILLSIDWTKVLVGYLVFIKIVTTLRDAIDTTPGKDTNLFEKGVTVLQKVAAALTSGKRPS